MYRPSSCPHAGALGTEDGARKDVMRQRVIDTRLLHDQGRAADQGGVRLVTFLNYDTKTPRKLMPSHLVARGFGIVAEKDEITPIRHDHLQRDRVFRAGRFGQASDLLNVGGACPPRFVN